MKICTKCHENKATDSFNKDRSKRDGLMNWCRPCHKIHYSSSSRREANILRMRAYRSSPANKAKEKVNRREYMKKYMKLRKAHDPVFKLICAIRSRLNKAIKSKSWTKKSSHRSHLGCTAAELKLHLESLFQPGMSWENHGKWHIDHINPLSNAATLQELNTLSHYSNLQPLWAQDNLKKSNKVA